MMEIHHTLGIEGAWAGGAATVLDPGEDGARDASIVGGKPAAPITGSGGGLSLALASTSTSITSKASAMVGATGLALTCTSGPRAESWACSLGDVVAGPATLPT